MPTVLKLNDVLSNRVEELARSRNQTAQAFVEDALHRHVEREEQRDQFQREALESLEAYRADGLHLTGEEVFAWLRTWGTADERPAPTCHT